MSNSKDAAQKHPLCEEVRRARIESVGAVATASGQARIDVLLILDDGSAALLPLSMDDLRRMVDLAHQSAAMGPRSPN